MSIQQNHDHNFVIQLKLFGFDIIFLVFIFMNCSSIANITVYSNSTNKCIIIFAIYQRH